MALVLAPLLEGSAAATRSALAAAAFSALQESQREQALEPRLEHDLLGTCRVYAHTDARKRRRRLRRRRRRRRRTRRRRRSRRGGGGGGGGGGGEEEEEEEEEAEEEKEEEEEQEEVQRHGALGETLVPPNTRGSVPVSLAHRRRFNIGRVSVLNITPPALAAVDSAPAALAAVAFSAFAASATALSALAAAASR